MKPKPQDRGRRLSIVLLLVVVLVVPACVAASLAVWLNYVASPYGD